MKTPILETSRLWLKPLKEEDAPGAFLWTGDPKVSWYMRYETHESLEDTKQWLREEEKQLESDLLYDFGFHKKDSDELIVKDANGNLLADGDSVTVVKDLKVKGSSSMLKIGTKVKNIRLVEGDHNIDCKIDGFGPMKLKSEFVKKN